MKHVNRSGIVALGLLCCTIALMVWWLYNIQQTKEEMSMETSPAGMAFSRESEYTDMAGNPVYLDEYLGQNIVVLSWATWCPACGSQLSLVGRVAQEFSEVTAVAINRGETSKIATSYLDYFGIDESVTLILDPGDRFFSTVDGFAMPELVLFDREGSIAYQKHGPISESELRAALSRLD